MGWDDHADGAVGIITTAPSPALSGTTFTLSSGDGAVFPAVVNGYEVYVYDPLDPSNGETMRVGAHVALSDSFTGLTRDSNGEGAKAVAIGWKVAMGVTKKVITDLEAGMADGLPVVGTIAGVQASWDALPADGGILKIPENTPITYVATPLLFTGKQNATVIWPKSSPLKFPANNTSPVGMLRIGDSTNGAINLLAADAAVGAVSISVATDDDLVEDGYITIIQNVGVSTGYRQNNRIKSISGGGPYTLELYEPLYVPFTFGAPGTQVLAITSPMEGFRLDGLHVDGNGNTGTHVRGVTMTHCPGAVLNDISGESFDGALILATNNYKASYDIRAFDNGSANEKAIWLQYETGPTLKLDCEGARSWPIVIDQCHGWRGSMRSNKSTARGVNVSNSHWGVGDIEVLAGLGTGLAITETSSYNQIRAKCIGNADEGLWFSDQANLYNVVDLISYGNDPGSDSGSGGRDLFIGATDLHNTVLLRNANAVGLVCNAVGLNWVASVSPSTAGITGFFTATGGTFTVAAGDIEAYDWQIFGKKANLNVRVIGGTTASAPSALVVAFPTGWVAAEPMGAVPCAVFETGTYRPALAVVAAAGTGVTIVATDGLDFANTAFLDLIFNIWVELE
jgi:hypothetical protein